MIVSHAGTGTILTALEMGKPILVMPRRATLSEHRSDHQVETARFFATAKKITVAFDESELFERLDGIQLISRPNVAETRASAELINAIREFLDS